MPALSLSVRDYMSLRFATLTEHQSLQEASKIMIEREVLGAPVVDNVGNLIGILSVTDCIGAAISSGYNPGWSGKVGDVMSCDVRTVDVDDNIMDVAKSFMNEPYRRYPVVDDNRVVGMVSRLDVLKALRKVSEAGVPV